MTMEITQSKEAGPEHVDEKGPGPDFGDSRFLHAEAAQATAAEHNLSLLQALKTYKRAAFWSVRKWSTIPSPTSCQCAIMLDARLTNNPILFQ